MLFVLLICCLFTVKACALVVLDSDDSRVDYVGRYLLTEQGNAVLSWGGTTLRLAVKGAGSVAAELGGGKGGSRFMALVDGVPLDPFVVTPEPGNYTLVTGLDAEASHSVELMKLAEDNVQKGSKGAATFSRFFLRSDGDGDGKIDVSRFQSKARRIHFVGDSDTAGWCADGSPRSGDDANSFQNPYITWAGQLARSLDADYYATAISGIGVMDWPIQQYLDHTVTFDDTYKWDWTAKSGLPDAVVVLIWPNDDSSKTSKFKKSYQDLVTMLGNRYGSSIPVLHVCGGSINGLDPCDAIKEVVGVENFVSIKREDWAQINKRTNDFLGCDSHYNERGHEVLMEDVVEDVKRILGWGGVK